MPGNKTNGSKREQIRKKLMAEDRPQLISEIATARQLHYGTLENIALVTHLPGTGGSVRPSQPREKLLDIMRRNDVPEPNSVLDSKQTAMVVALAAIPPAVRKGDRVNVSVKLSSHAEAQDLAHGWLRETALVEMGNLGGRVRESFDRAKAEGPLVTLAQYTGSQDPQAKLDAVVVGGARMLKERELAIGLSSEFADALTMAAVVPAINRRFTYFDGHQQAGIATPISDDYIELKLPSRYAADPEHFINVVLHLGFGQSSDQQTQRIEQLAKQLDDPSQVQRACWELEAAGQASVLPLAARVNHPSDTVRFCCAHALAYLGDASSIPTLVELAGSQPLLRGRCLAALSSIDHYQAEDALKGLVHQAEPETRYGALRSLRRRNARDPLVQAEQIPQVGGLLVVPSHGPALVAVSMFEVPEIVFFGPVPKLQLADFHNVNPSILIQPTGPQQMTVSHFIPDQQTQIVQCADDLRSVLQAIGQVGGGYGDWVNLVRQCHESKLIDVPVCMNPVPNIQSPLEADDESSATTTADAGQAMSPSSTETTDRATGTAWLRPWSWWN
ncbi:MAG: flagellar basal body P-ring protein FlgI [Pirellulaceae bacterium]|nr:flagellar basal body P-ring protein FlgI [Pirellulaceae bacterium]